MHDKNLIKKTPFNYTDLLIENKLFLWRFPHKNELTYNNSFHKLFSGWL